MKFKGKSKCPGLLRVTLYARVWIEITLPTATKAAPLVTLYARVWIEIDVNVSVEPKPSSPST